MDAELFESDLKVAVKKLPPRLIVILKQLAGEFGPTLDKMIPQLMADLMPHIRAIGFEGAMGQLDKEELNTIINKVLAEAV